MAKIIDGLGDSFTSPLSFPRKRWFDRPFDRLTVLSNVEGLTVLSKVEGRTSLSKAEGESRYRLLAANYIPALVFHDRRIMWN